MPHTHRPGPAEEALEASNALVAERKGVPMLISVRGAGGRRGGGDGARPAGRSGGGDGMYADTFGDWHRRLGAGADDEAAVIRALQAVAYSRLGPGRSRPDSAREQGGTGHGGAPGGPSTDTVISAAGTAADLRAGHFIRVVNYHNTPPGMRDELFAELRSYATDFSTVDLDDLDRFSRTGVWHKDRPGLLPVFYEGYRDNYDVGAAACDEAGVIGWFFVCTAFVDAPVPEQYDFASAHRIKLVPENPRGERIAMSWDEIADLHRRGHVVTPHTASHELAERVRTAEDVEREIAAPKRRMDEVTGGSAACTAWLGGTHWTGAAATDRALVEAGYRFLFSNTMVQRIAD